MSKVTLFAIGVTVVKVITGKDVESASYAAGGRLWPLILFRCLKVRARPWGRGRKYTE